MSWSGWKIAKIVYPRVCPWSYVICMYCTCIVNQSGWLQKKCIVKMYIFEGWERSLYYVFLSVCVCVFVSGCLVLPRLTVKVCQREREVESWPVCRWERVCVCLWVCVCVCKAADGTCHYQSHKSLAPGMLTLCPRGKEPAEVEESSGFPRLKLARLSPASAFLGCQHSVNVWTALNK